jgi:hypothetical protein
MTFIAALSRTEQRSTPIVRVFWIALGQRDCRITCALPDGQSRRRAG